MPIEGIMRAPLLAAVWLLVACQRDGATTSTNAIGTPAESQESAAAIPKVTLTPLPNAAAEALADARAWLAPGLQADPQKTLKRLTDTFGTAPNDPEAALELVRAAFRSEELARCRVAIDALLALPPGEHPEWIAEGWMVRGWIDERAGHYADAIANVQKALAIQPNYPFAQLRLGIALVSSGDTVNGIAAIEKAIAAKPGLNEAHFQLAKLYRRAGRDADADREAAIHRALTTTVDNTANTKESVMGKLAAYEELEKLLPADVDARLQLTRMQIGLGRREQALDRMRALLLERGDVADAWTLYVELIRKVRGDDFARADLKDLLAHAANVPAEERATLERWIEKGFGK